MLLFTVYERARLAVKVDPVYSELRVVPGQKVGWAPYLDDATGSWGVDGRSTSIHKRDGHPVVAPFVDGFLRNISARNVLQDHVLGIDG